MPEGRYDFYDDDWYDGAAVMTLRGRKERLETLFNLSDVEKEESSKAAIATDTHYGMRKGSQIFYDYFEKFYSETFFPT